MGQILAGRRRRGEPWDDGAYRRLSGMVTRDLSPSERDDWAMVFASQRGVFQAAYERTLAVRYYLDVD